MRPVPWSERELAFGRETAELPVLLERIRGTPARIMELVAHTAPERLALRRQGSWSVQEHIAHLLVLQDRLEQRLDDFAACRSVLCTIDLADQGSLLRGHGKRPLGDLIEEFRLKRLYFVDRVLALDDMAMAHRAAHPCRTLSMGLADQVFFVAEHDDHHLAVMRHLAQGRRMGITL